MGETGMETGPTRPLPLLICDLEIPAGGTHPKIDHIPLAMEAVQKQHPRKREKTFRKRDFGLRFKPKHGAGSKRERCSGEENHARRRRKRPRWQIVILPQARLMRLSAIPKRSSRQWTCIGGFQACSSGIWLQELQQWWTSSWLVPGRDFQFTGCRSRRGCSAPTRFHDDLGGNETFIVNDFSEIVGGWGSFTDAAAAATSSSSCSCRSRRRQSCSDLSWWIYRRLKNKNKNNQNKSS